MAISLGSLRKNLTKLHIKIFSSSTASRNEVLIRNIEVSLSNTHIKSKYHIMPQDSGVDLSPNVTSHSLGGVVEPLAGSGGDSH